MQYWTLFAIFFAYTIQIPSVVDASPTKNINTNKGYYRLEKRDRKVHKISDLNIEDIANLRQWDEDEYNAIMSTMSGGTNNLRHRQLQNGNNNEPYQQKPQYTSTQTVTTGWQKAALISCGLVFFGLLFYVISLRNELAHLNQYIPLGYKLFPDNAEEESEERPSATGVEMF